MDREAKLRELAELRTRVEKLETELGAMAAPTEWPPRGYYGAYYALTGALLGIAGAAVSLACNVVGSIVWSRMTNESQNPLRLIQVYLTFPLGESALSTNNGLALVIGSCLYLATGMLYGVLIQMAQARFAPRADLFGRMMFMGVLSLGIWLVNFYVLLEHLQPALIGGNWIVEQVPWWVAALTHLVFGWTMALLYPYGVFVPYQPQAESP